jgi:hypothetical protein
MKKNFRLLRNIRDGLKACLTSAIDEGDGGQEFRISGNNIREREVCIPAIT